MRKLAATIAVLLPLGASAQEEKVRIYPPPPSELRNYNDAFAGVGIGGFTRELGDFTNLGFAWNARITWSSMRYRYVGVALDYQGILSGVRDVILSNGANPGGTSITQHQIALNLKFTYPIALGERSAFEPYFFGGVGYAHFTTEVLFSPDNTKIDNAGAFPIGGGFSFLLRNNIVLDGRLTYNFLTGERSPSIATGNSWQAAISLGYRVYSTP